MANKLIALGHGRSKTGAWDPGAHGNGTTEADWLRGNFLKSLKKYAGNKIDFYEQNMYANRDANTIKKYDDVIELHLDAASAAAKGGHVIIHSGYSPDALDNRLGATIQKHFGLRGGKMFDNRSNLYNLNVFAKRKISYRLLELGFITNKENMGHFKANYDAIARELVEDILNTKIESEVKPASSTEPNPIPKEDDKLYTPEVDEMTLATSRVLMRLADKGEQSIGKEWRDKLNRGELTESQAIGLIYVALDRGIVVGYQDQSDIEARLEALEKK